MSKRPEPRDLRVALRRQGTWDIGKPQPAFVEAAERVTGAVLDAGCGTGENALFFAGKGHPVLGIDFLGGPVEAARRKARSGAWTPSSSRKMPWTLEGARSAVR